MSVAAGDHCKCGWWIPVTHVGEISIDDHEQRPRGPRFVVRIDVTCPKCGQIYCHECVFVKRIVGQA